jgi:hypothetical protein
LPKRHRSSARHDTAVRLRWERPAVGSLPRTIYVARWRKLTAVKTAGVIDPELGRNRASGTTCGRSTSRTAPAARARYGLFGINAGASSGARRFPRLTDPSRRRCWSVSFGPHLSYVGMRSFVEHDLAGLAQRRLAAQLVPGWPGRREPASIRHLFRNAVPLRQRDSIVADRALQPHWFHRTAKGGSDANQSSWIVFLRFPNREKE